MISVRTSRLGTRGQPEESRAAILKAAVREFAQEGVAGARTDAIARSAGVNKALLYYYFKDKESLYGAVLDEVFGGLHQAVHEVLAKPLPPREKILAPCEMNRPARPLPVASRSSRTRNRAGWW